MPCSAAAAAATRRSTSRGIGGAATFSHASLVGSVDPFSPDLIDDDLSILQYADDTIFFFQDDPVQAKNLKILLCVFEQLSGLKINFHKNELYCFGKANDHVDQYAQILGCGVGKYPFKYLGIPMNFRKLTNKDWRTVEERFQKKLSSWKGKLLSYCGRLVLINSVLSSLAMYTMSFFEIPKGICKKLDFFRSGFFWQGDNHRKKYRLTKWGLLCLPKDQGGLGILNLEAQNTCLLSKWLYKLINEDGIWQQLFKKKYLKNKTIAEVFWKPEDSHFWSGLMKVKDRFMDLSTFQVHNGLQTRFWEDKALVGDKLIKWNDLVARVAFVQLDGHHDKAIWSLTKHGYFTVKSLYNFLVDQSALPLNKKLWKLKLPLKIKIFVWFLMKGVILTKDNLKKRNWNGDDGCYSNMRPLLCVGASAIGYILDKVLESTSKGGWQKLFEVGIPLVRDGGFRGVRKEWLARRHGAMNPDTKLLQIAQRFTDVDHRLEDLRLTDVDLKCLPFWIRTSCGEIC
ncbi:hypothetical protein U9M48_042332 [Paspalum notatum var. saurae]|uniref:Reverse transcriptase zinc-binding domain-containing protein n=1 Tax=Paspalum notatum var. saurae TaxID=547442 RepID=A0AAQ3XG26_PASNO